MDFSAYRLVTSQSLTRCVDMTYACAFRNTTTDKGTRTPIFVNYYIRMKASCHPEALKIIHKLMCIQRVGDKEILL